MYWKKKAKSQTDSQPDIECGRKLGKEMSLKQTEKRITGVVHGSSFRNKEVNNGKEIN